MDKKYQYREISTNETVEDFMAIAYVCGKLGLKIEPQENNKKLSQDQVEFLNETVDWYFSGNWIKEEIKDDE